MLQRKTITEAINLKLNWLAFNLESEATRQLLDLHIHSENFARDLLNCIYDTNFINLNDIRTNEPGIDLGDKEKRIAIQVTTQTGKNKVEKTLEKVIENKHTESYDTFYILILGEKQKSITIDQKYIDALNFNKDQHIVDLRDIQKKVHSLERGPLLKVFNFINAEIMDIYQLLGIDPTSILSNIEESPTYTYSNCGALISNYERKLGSNIDAKERMEMEISTKDLYDILYKLPHLSRELFYALVQKSEYRIGPDALCVNETEVYKIFGLKLNEYKIYLSMLENAHLLTCHENDTNPDLFYVILQGYPRVSHCLLNIKEFVDDMGLDPSKVFIDLDFSAFASTN
jgi:hypothetical protein